MKPTTTNKITTVTPQTYDLKTATAFVVANMIGTGVFTSLGYQLAGVDSVFAILLLWVIGGVVSICGALSYVALASLMPRSGGEYHYLSHIYGDAAGFVAGFITLTVGFSAPIAASALAFGSYMQLILPSNEALLAILAIVLIATIHVYDVRKGGSFHFWSTVIKVLLISIFIVLAFVFGESQNISILPQASDWKVLVSSSFVISSVYVTYAYTGWNASVYILDEVENPKKTIPFSILLGTLLVTILYLLLNYAFMYVAPLEAMKGKVEVGQVAAQYLFGTTGAKIMSGLIAIGLVSALSAMIVTGSRVVKAMAEDYTRLTFLNRQNRKGAPYAAIILIASLAILLVLTATFDVILTYAGFIISIFGSTAVLGLFILKYRQPNIQLPFGKWFFPVIPAIYLLINCWIIVYLIAAQPIIALYGVVTLFVGYLLYKAISL